jgi:hypothetical protein
MGVYSEHESLTTEERKALRQTLLEDRGPAYIPWLVEKFGAQAGLFMSQLLFWDGKGHDPDGWIYKSEKEWRNETGLTRSAVRNARKILTKKGVLEEDKRGLPRRLYYRANLRALMAVLNGEPLRSDPEDLWNEDPWDEDQAPEKNWRVEEELPSVYNVNSSEEGITGLTGEEDSSRLTGEETNTGLPREEHTTLPTSKAGTTDRAYTENTSENTAETLQREEAGESPLQGCANREFAQLNQGKEIEKEGVELAVGDSSERLSDPTSIPDLIRKKSRAEETERATSSEIQRIHNMLIDERYPTCGVYRRFEEGRLSDEQLLEAVSYELTGSFTEGERFREAVEGCVQMLKDEEDIA